MVAPPQPRAPDQGGMCSWLLGKDQGLDGDGGKGKAPEWLVELVGANPTTTRAALPWGLGWQSHGPALSARNPRACIQDHSRKHRLAIAVLLSFSGSAVRRIPPMTAHPWGPPGCSGISWISLTSCGTQAIYLHPFSLSLELRGYLSHMPLPL